MKDKINNSLGITDKKRALLEKLRREKKAKPVASSGIPLREDRRNAPLSFAQERLWFLDQFDPGNPVYNIAVRVRFTGRLDVGVFEKSLNEVVQRHEILRTIFPLQNGKPVQKILSKPAFKVSFVDFSKYSNSEKIKKTNDWARKESQTRFDLQKGPLLKTSLLRLDENTHEFLLTLHHIISDAGAFAIFFQELSVSYRAFLIGVNPDLPVISIQFGDYADWERNRVSEPMFQTHLDYWKRKLSGKLPVLQLPADHPRPSLQTHPGDQKLLSIPPGLVKKIKSLASAENVTPFMMLLSAFYLLLYRYSGQTDIFVGSTIANRSRGETRGLIGFFQNTLILREYLSGDVGFRQLLKQVRQTTLKAFDHQSVPFEKLVEILQPERLLNMNPLFQAAFLYQNTPERQSWRNTLNLPGITAEPEVIHNGTAKFDITLGIEERENDMAASIEYNTDLFNADTIEQMLDHYQMLLEGVVADPDQSIATLPILTDVERRKMLIEWNATEADYPQNRCFYDLFEAQAKQTPNAIAAIFPAPDSNGNNANRLTYKTLNERANQFAHFLRKHHAVGSGMLVGICLDRSPEMLVALLGILKSGAAYVPLDPNYPSERLAFMIKDANLKLLITQKNLFSKFSIFNFQTSIISLDSDWSAIANENTANPKITLNSENLAYVIYTSGSTGKPKGVQISHRALTNFLCAMQQSPGIKPGDILLSVTTLSFDIATLELYAPLISGAATALASSEAAADGLQLLKLLKTSGATIMQATPATWRMLIDSGWKEKFSLKILCGGEALPADLAADLLMRGDSLWNMYGPTETTVWSAVKKIENAENVFIGSPIANTQFYVLDAHQQPVPAGVPGELYISGDGLARGYLNRSELTTERFIKIEGRGEKGEGRSEKGEGRGGKGEISALPPSPFSFRLYKTGDLVRYRSGGELEFLGRIDHQVKIRGFRIELGEIEATLTEHPAIAQAVVVAREDTPGNKQLAAYLITENEKSLEAAKLRNLLAQSLPHYMVPAHFVFMKNFPLTPNGKIDRRALPAPASTSSVSEKTIVSPRNHIEELVANAWSAVLGIERIGIFDNFFDLGGHSLKIIQLISRMRDAFNVEISVRSFFETPTIAGLAKKIDAHLQNNHEPVRLPIKPVSGDSRRPLSFAQQRLWFLDRLEPQNSAYNIPLALRLTGRPDVNILQKCLLEIVERHEALRTAFLKHNSQPIQTVSPPGDFSLSIEDLTNFTEDERKETAEKIISEKAFLPFDLQNGALFRGWMLKLRDDDHILLLTMHHIISDGRSLEIILWEIGERYRAHCQKRSPEMNELAIQYSDFAVWQRQWLTGDTLNRQLDYWKRQLENVSILQLPTDFPRPAEQAYRGAQASLELSEALTQSLKTLSRNENVTVFMLLLAAFQVFLHRYSGQTDIAVGSPIAGRNHSEVEHLIGFFANTLVLRGKVSGESSFREFLQQVRQVCLDAYAHQDVPFEKLVETLRPQRDMSRNPLFQAMFVFQNTPWQPPEMPGLKVSPIEIPSQTSKFDLSLAAVEVEGKFRFYMEYSTDLFLPETIQRMLANFQTLLEGIVAQPGKPIAVLPILNPTSQNKILGDWIDTAMDYPKAVCIHHLFERQVKRTPEAIAAVWREDKLTFEQLNSRANRLANYLLKRGVNPGDLIGVCMNRSLEMLVGILGILKAGAAYVPLDPNYPSERLMFMIKDANLNLLITQERLFTQFSPKGQAIFPKGAGNFQSSIISLDSDRAAIAKESAENPENTVNSKSLAYIIYTSGSTGKPKGVAIEHRNTAALLHWAKTVFDEKDLQGVLASTSICFDLSVFEIFTPLSWGGTIVLAENALELPNLPAKNQVRLINTVPSAMVELLRQNAIPKGVCTVNLAGEPLRAAVVNQLYESGVERVFDLYGPSEDTTYSTFTLREKNGVETIGKPIANTQAYIFDKNMQPVPIGAPGELYLGGDGVAREYLNRPELTADRFVEIEKRGVESVERKANNLNALRSTLYALRPTPHDLRLYKTGDLARWLPDGNIEFLGRMDHQVKIRGFRIELGEIETALNEHKMVSQAVVVDREFPGGDKRLIAYIINNDDDPLKPSDLRRFLRKKLPEFMIPSDFVMPDQLPLTPNGKIDRKALPVPGVQFDQAADIFDAPETPVELSIARIWAEALGVKKIGRNDNFFDLGGHSLLAVQVIGQIEKRIGAKLNPRDILLQTLQQLAARCSAAALSAPENASANATLKKADSGKGIIGRLKKLVNVKDKR